MSQHSEKKNVINGAQCSPALYLNEGSIGMVPFTPAPPQERLLLGPLASGKGTTLLNQHIPFWLLGKKKDGGWWVGAGLGGAGRETFLGMWLS